VTRHRHRGRTATGSESPLAAALSVVGDRWTALVIEALMEGPRRFGDLQAALPGIAPNVLTQRLRELEGRALVVAQPYSERPPRFVYELTDGARELAGALRLLADWGRARPAARRRTTRSAARRCRRAGGARPASSPSTTTTRATPTGSRTPAGR
jgi:DNA-binding HxlR family transcriptional regulator